MTIFKRDMCGRIRITIDGVRISANKSGSVSVLHRYTPFANAERKQHNVDLTSVQPDVLRKLADVMDAARV